MNASINPFEIALGIQKPWKITDTQLTPSEKNPDRLEMHIYVDFEEGTRFPCPVCGEECQVHDTRERVWRHLNFFQYRCYIHARVPRTMRRAWGQDCGCAMGTRRLGIHAHDGGGVEAERIQPMRARIKKPKQAKR